MSKLSIQIPWHKHFTDGPVRSTSDHSANRAYNQFTNQKNSHHPLQIQIKCLYLQSCSKNRPTNLGEVVEWSITAVLKTVELKGSGGSNPSLSANNLKLSAKRWAFFVQGRQELAPVRTCAGKAQRP